MISETDIVSGYLWLLGRVPSVEEITKTRLHYGATAREDVQEFQRSLLLSEEFRNRRLRALVLQRTAPVSLSGSRLVFMHILKCGGTTLHTMLASQFPPELICPERHDTLGDWTINELSAYELFSGHYDLAWCRSIPGDVRMVTLLREPKARLLSLYYFWKSHRPHPDRDVYDLMLLARDCSAEEFFDHPVVAMHTIIRNGISGQLTRMTNRPKLDIEDPVMADPDAVLAGSWEALRSFASFGIMERFEESRILLNRMLGLSMQPIEPLQVLEHLVRTNDQLVPVSVTPVSPHLDQLLDRLTTIDRPLYARAVTLFDQRVRNTGAGAAFALPEAAPRTSLLKQVAGVLRRGTGA
ncbi:MAG: sulfotransferase domain-containing protein [Janthinobacterium lividum]